MLKQSVVLLFILLASSLYAQDKKKDSTKNNPVIQEAKVNYKALGTDLPAIRLKTTDDKTINEADIKSSGNLFLMLFNPNCAHCEDETDSLEKHMDLFKKSKLVMVAGDKMKEYLVDFERLHSVRRYPIIIGLDDAGIIDKTFQYTALPQINIYSPEHKLIKIFFGDTRIDSLKPYIQ